MNIKPIPTTYRGITFRSKLEAHWAVYFDRCGVNWEYEPQGFDLGDGIWYLPDFLLHDVKYWDGVSNDLESKDLWVEVKGVMDSASIDKIERFAYGDRETQAKCMKKITEEELNKSLEGPLVNNHIKGFMVFPPVQRSILVVGQMPLIDNFEDPYRNDQWEPRRSLGYWVSTTFGEMPARRLFYFGRTIANDHTYVFPIINKGGKMEIRESHLIGDSEFEQTIEALDYARNYRFDHKK